MYTAEGRRERIAEEKMGKNEGFIGNEERTIKAEFESDPDAGPGLKKMLKGPETMDKEIRGENLSEDDIWDELAQLRATIRSRDQQSSTEKLFRINLILDVLEKALIERDADAIFVNGARSIARIWLWVVLEQVTLAEAQVYVAARPDWPDNKPSVLISWLDPKFRLFWAGFLGGDREMAWDELTRNQYDQAVGALVIKPAMRPVLGLTLTNIMSADLANRLDSVLDGLRGNDGPN